MDSIATITANASGYVTVGGKTYQINVFGRENAAAKLNDTLYPTVSAAVKDAKAGDTIVLLNTNTTPEETVEIPVGVTVQVQSEITFRDAYYQVKNGDGVVAEIPVQSENGKAVLFLPSSAPEVEALQPENLHLRDGSIYADGAHRCGENNGNDSFCAPPLCAAPITTDNCGASVSYIGRATPERI